MKTCTKCGETKQVSGFNRNKNSKDGLASRCKACRKADRRAAYVDPDLGGRVRARNRAWRMINKEHKSAYEREYRQTDDGYWSERKRRWRSIGITDVDTLDWEALIESQGNACKVCGDIIDARSAIRDHDHETGLTRAAVCSSKCNHAMDRI